VLDLSPTKLLIIFVVVVVLLGPKRLPEVARQLGAAWRKVREFHSHVDRELRQTLPDLPTSQEIVRFARSPISLLNQLADRPDRSAETDGSSESSTVPPLDGAEDAAGRDGSRVDGNGRGGGIDGDGRSARRIPSLAGLDTDDPNLN
jgi:TatA/E family protein of Tat protein translocase